MLNLLINTKTFRQLFFLSLMAVFGLMTGCSGKSEANKENINNSSPTDKVSVGGDVYERPYSPHIGPVDAKVTIVEFFDPACSACRTFYQVVKEIVTRHPDDVRLVLRYVPFHRGSETVVKMLEAAREQNIFGQVLEALLKDQDQWASHQKPNLDRAWELAEMAGLNVALATTVMNSEETKAVIEQEKADIDALNIQRTPTFYVNKRPLTHLGPQELYQLVVSEMKK